MDLTKHLENAADAVKRRNYSYAVKLYSQLLVLQPDSAEARAGLRVALFRKAELKPPAKLLALVFGGIHLLTAGLCRVLRQHGAAAKAYERYLVMDPMSEGANVKLGDSLERAGLSNAARAVFQAYTDANPRCLEACRRAGALLYENGEHAAAMLMYERALKIDPRDQESLKARKNLAAEGALKASGIETATTSRDLVKNVEEARKLDRDDRLQLSKEEIDAEVDRIEAALQENPGNVKSLVRMADLLLMDEDHKGALDSLEQAVAQDPHNSELQNRAGSLRLRLQELRVEAAEKRGDDSAAEFARKALQDARVAEYRRRVEQNPTDLRLRFALGKALRDVAQHDDAIAELQQAVKDPKVKGESYLLLGESFAAKGMDDLAMTQLHKALEVLRDTGQKGKEVLYAMGCVAQNMGESDQALAHFSRILEEDIGFRDVQQKIEALKSAS